ncbi:MAG: hypothetical protein ABI748_11705 [Dokdonella sp.]
MQQIVRINTGTDFVGTRCAFEQRLKCRAKVLLEVSGQGFEGRVSRVQRRGKSTFGRDEICIPLHPLGQRNAGHVLGRKARSGLGAGIDLLTEDSCHQVRTLREVAVNRAYPDACRLRDCAHRCIHANAREYLLGRLQHPVDVPPRIGAHWPIPG